MTIANTLNNTTLKKNNQSNQNQNAKTLGQSRKFFKSVNNANKKKVNFEIGKNEEIPYMEIINPEK